MILNDSEWFWMILNDSEWLWMTLNDSEWLEKEWKIYWKSVETLTGETQIVIPGAESLSGGRWDSFMKTSFFRNVLYAGQPNIWRNTANNTKIIRGWSLIRSSIKTILTPGKSNVKY